MRRRAGESFMIGAGIEIEVLEITGSRVKLGIVAPASVEITRKETHLTRSENLFAAQPVDPIVIDRLLTRIPAAPTSEHCQTSDTRQFSVLHNFPTLAIKKP
jgi:carbon storage regulator